jgi:hypothetical protein
METRRLLPIPSALLAAFVFCWPSAGRMVARIFCGMWVHEIGHALTAWLCGFVAFPGPWFTPTASTRSTFFAVFVLCVWGALAFLRPAWRWLFIALAALQLWCSAVLSDAAARQLIVFMGDGGCLVLGALLMSTWYVSRESSLYRGWLRWGFLVIGALAFADVFSLWFGARSNPDLIPFGMNEGVGLSDPSVLSEVYGWSASELTRRYVALGSVCLCALFATSLWFSRTNYGARSPAPESAPPQPR